MKHLTYCIALCGVLLGAMSPLCAQNAGCKPTIGVINGLATSVRPVNTDSDPLSDETGVWLHVKDFVKYGYSDCVPGPLQYGIRVSAANTGFPSDTLIYVQCGGSTLERVEIWAKDALGTATFTESYVLLQDNKNLCDSPVEVSTVCTNDKIGPDLYVLNGLSINLHSLASGGWGAQVKVYDFVERVSDNCATNIKLRIRKSGSGIATPPLTTAISLNCDELGVQLIEIWAGDTKGNWTVVETYILVENVLGCENAPPTVCSPDHTGPEVVVLNGIATNLGTSGLVSVKALDFLRRKTDNCSLTTNAVRIKKKSGPTNIVPTTTSVSYSCADLGTQLVEIWVRDMPGNWSKTEGYVLIEDNTLLCGQAAKEHVKQLPEWKELILKGY